MCSFTELTTSVRVDSEILEKAIQDKEISVQG